MDNEKAGEKNKVHLACDVYVYHDIVHHTLTHSHLHTRKKDLRLESEQPLYLTIDNKTVVEGGLTLKEVYNTSHHKGDKHLHVAYSSKDITDPDTS